MEGVGSDTAIPLPNVTGKILAKVIEYCKYHLEHPTPANEDKKVNSFSLIIVFSNWISGRKEN